MFALPTSSISPIGSWAGSARRHVELEGDVDVARGRVPGHVPLRGTGDTRARIGQDMGVVPDDQAPGRRLHEEVPGPQLVKRQAEGEAKDLGRDDQFAPRDGCCDVHADQADASAAQAHLRAVDGVDRPGPLDHRHAPSLPRAPPPTSANVQVLLSRAAKGSNSCTLAERGKAKGRHRCRYRPFEGTWTRSPCRPCRRRRRPSREQTSRACPPRPPRSSGTGRRWRPRSAAPSA